MSKSIIGKKLWAEMTEVQKVKAVRSGRATLKQMTGGLLDGSDDLRKACNDFLAHTDVSLEDISVDTDSDSKSAEEASLKLQGNVRRVRKRRKPSKTRKRITRTRKTKQRFGLPEGFTPRLQRLGRSLLLDDNVYRLPSGDEFVPQHPTGTLGKLHHLYALLTLEQYDAAKRGSVYVRTDGRVFDYSVDHGDPEREMFDTGFTISDLERTGRYAPQPSSNKRQIGGVKHRQAAHASLPPQRRFAAGDHG